MITPEEMRTLADKLDEAMKGYDCSKEAFEAVGMLRSIAAEREWRDMETAPKDGTWVQLKGGVIDYGWDGETKPPIVSAQFVAGSSDEDTRWRFANYDGGYYGVYENPTAWRPLPKGAE